MSQKSHKGKQGTRGTKQIMEENKETLLFYRYLVLGSNAIFLATSCVMSSLFSTQNIVLLIFAGIIYVSCYQFMAYIARSKYTDSGQLIDCGVDLNMEGGISENVKDIIIVTVACQTLSIFSNHFWWLWLAVPARAGWMFWSSIMGPWLSQAPEQEPVDEKKQRKMERRMARGRN